MLEDTGCDTKWYAKIIPGLGILSTSGSWLKHDEIAIRTFPENIVDFL
jgi:hypothetical protein